MPLYLLQQYLNLPIESIQIYLMLGRVIRSLSTSDPEEKAKQKPVPMPQSKSSQLLPDQISGRILDLQLQCQKQTISKQVVFDLITEYSKAIQFYQEKGNDKYKLYQRRMQQFMSKPLIESILKGQSGEMIMKKQKKDEILRKQENKAQKQVKQLIQKQQQKQKKHQSFIKQQLNKQDQVLEQRIRKKRTMSNRSTYSKRQDPDGTPNPVSNPNNQQSGKKKPNQKLNMKLFIAGIEQRSQVAKKVFL